MGPTPRGPLLLAVLFCVARLACGNASQAQADPFDSPLRCVEPPHWSSGGASRLEILRQDLAADGLADINFLVVNSGGWSRLLSYQLSNRVSFPVYEEGYFTSIWETLHGGKDDILVYDRCGFLTYQLRMPYSFLTYPYVEGAIRVTYHGDYPCNCSIGESQMTTKVPPMKDGIEDNQALKRNETLQYESDDFETNITTNSSREVEPAGNITVASSSRTTNNPSNMTEAEPESEPESEPEPEPETEPEPEPETEAEPHPETEPEVQPEVRLKELIKLHRHHDKQYDPKK